ncbi:MAG: hypothetical protein F6K19_10785 [Cyanothece sp. SIO1E1]|nr:hypothetical protein [Cyanothece sp. SIO1E1]
MSISQVLTYMVLGTVLGAFGQGARAAVGLKKKFDQNPGSELKDWFDLKRLLLSLLMGAIAGCLSSILLLEADLDSAFFIALLSAGYAGTDFIEGTLTRKAPPQES